MPKLLTEFLGTFFLVLIIALCLHAQSPYAPLAIGVGLAALVAMGAHVSGAQYNPAVALGVLLAGSMSVKDFVRYVLAQCAGAFVAAIVFRTITGVPLFPAPSPSASLGAAFAVEVLFTLLLVLVVLNVALHPKAQGNQYFPFAIGLTVAAAATAGGTISGGAFNPAVGVMPLLAHAIRHGGEGLTHAWLYIAGPCAGAAIAAAIYRVQRTPATTA